MSCSLLLKCLRPRYLILLLTPLLTSACGDAAAPDAGGDDAAASQSPRYETRIRWTRYGIPHVQADDWSGLGYGFAYATARDAVCTIARDVLMVNGELSRWFGEGEGRLLSDVGHRAILTPEMMDRFRESQSERAGAFAGGYVAGYNRYLRDHEGRLPQACAGAEWVRPLDGDDIDRLAVGVGIRYGLGQLLPAIANAAPPGEPVAAVPLDVAVADPGQGSNAVAMGREVTASGRGLLLGNPHYPWQGSSRFHMIHTTIPGEVDVMGVSLYTTNRVAIGFNQDVAWSHTVSTGLRSTFYALELNPEDPTQYRYGEDYRDMQSRDVEVTIRDEQGGLDTQTRTVYQTHYGPVVVADELPWTREQAFAIRDANLHNDRSAATYDALNRATSIDEVEQALEMQGVAWTNTIAADRHGTAFYADISAVPNVDAGMLERCNVAPESMPGRMIILDGSDPECEWREDPRSAIPGVMPAEEMPRQRRDDYVHNANDSYWLSNPDQPLEGYSPVIGPEGTPRSLRTRAGLTFIREALDSGRGMRPRDLQQMLYSHRHYGAELLLDDLLSLCRNETEPVALEGGDTVDIQRSCDVLAAWDRRQQVDSRGGHVWREFWREAGDTDNLYRVPFDIEEPVDTPRGLNVEDGAVRSELLRALARAQRRLEENGIALDAPLGEIQYSERSGERIPIPGGQGGAGMWSVITAQLRSDAGYTPIQHGNSYIQVIGWDDDGELDARGILTYSQSEYPESPHYADQTRLYSQGEWVDLPFHEEEIASDPELETLTLSE